MNWTQHLQRLAGVVIIMITCLVASPAAYAHAGHDHAASPEVTRSAAIVDMDTSADDSVPQIIEAKAEISPALPATKKRCTGGCCTSSHACCAASLPVHSGAPVPDGAPRDSFIEPHLRNGLDPEALRKPPRSFA